MPVGVFPGFTSNAIWGAISGDIDDQADLQAELLSAQGISSTATSVTRLALTGKPYGYVVHQTDNGFNYQLIDADNPDVAGSWVATPKVYAALLTQTSTNAPVATVEQNTLGGVPVWTRNGTGDYRLTLSGAFTANQTIPVLTSFDGSFATGGGAPIDSTSGFVWISANVMGFVVTTGGTPQDEQLNGYPVILNVYP